MFTMQYIVVIAVTVLLDIIQLGLYFEGPEDALGHGDSEQHCIGH